MKAHLYQTNHFRTASGHLRPNVRLIEGGGDGTPGAGGSGGDDGGAGDDAGAAADAAAAAGGDADAAKAAADAAAAAEAQATEEARKAAEAQTSPWDDPVAAKAEIEKLRRENAADRTNAKATAATEARTALTKELATAAGLAEDATPEALTAHLKTLTTSANEAATTVAVYRAAGTLQADPAALLDSRSFLAKVQALQPSDNEFDKKVAEAIKTSLEANPSLRLSLVPARSGGDMSGRSGEGARSKTPRPLGEAVGAHYTNA